ncbi:protein of unknown function (plasmid) [Thermococcus nautili]|nr:hypothetical protein [Thermococcus nautili]CAI1494143.1 protein of unknown function [Thermococcus nautili]
MVEPTGEIKATLIMGMLKIKVRNLKMPFISFSKPPLVVLRMV